MSTAAVLTRAGALYRREVAKFLQNLAASFGVPLVSVGTFLLVFKVGLQGPAYARYLFPGLLSSAVVFGAYMNSALNVLGWRLDKSLENLLVSPLSYLEMASAFVAAAVTRAFLTAAVALLLGCAFGVVQVVHPLGLLLALTLSSVLLAAIGVSGGLLSRTYEHAFALHNVFLLPLAYLSGAFFPLSRLPPLWRALAQASPLTYSVSALRWSLGGTPDVPVFLAWAVLSVLSVGALWLAAALLRRRTRG